jgi:hypothetical protein
MSNRSQRADETRFWCPKEQEWLSLSEMAYRQIAKSATGTMNGAVSAPKADAREEEQIATGLSEVPTCI